MGWIGRHHRAVFVALTGWIPGLVVWMWMRWFSVPAEPELAWYVLVEGLPPDPPFLGIPSMHDQWLACRTWFVGAVGVAGLTLGWAGPGERFFARPLPVAGRGLVAAGALGVALLTAHRALLASQAPALTSLSVLGLASYALLYSAVRILIARPESGRAPSPPTKAKPT